MYGYSSVADLLTRKHFRNIEIIAGNGGLNRAVKWVHIVEVTNIRNLLKGEELILSTCVAWAKKEEVFTSMIKQLIEANAAGLCIEIGTYTSAIPDEAIRIAEEHQFPIILFLEEVSFVEITQDIHTFLINQQHQMISSLEYYSQTLHKKLLGIEFPDEILAFMHQTIQVQAMLVFRNGDIILEPEQKQSEKELLLKKWQYHKEWASSIVNDDRMSTMPIDLLGENYAELAIIPADRPLNEYDHLIMDRTATALAQFFMREMYVSEKRRSQEAEAITGWLDGNLDETSIHEYLSYYLSSVNPNGSVVCLLQFPAKIPDLTYFKLYFRSIFEQRGIRFLAMEKKNIMTLLLFDERDKETWKARMEEGFKKLFENGWKLKTQDIPQICIGKYFDGVEQIPRSYQTAKETMRVRGYITDNSLVCFYDNLHLYRIIAQLHRQMDLREQAEEYLGKIMAHDRKYNGKLLETLRVYLACNGSKKETANKLYIVRQTLYHRLDKIEAMLGTDFMEQDRRLTIEFYLKVIDFLEMGEKRSIHNHSRFIEK